MPHSRSQPGNEVEASTSEATCEIDQERTIAS
jgi:hypothetical protein